MGEVWAARNERTGREFALKVLLASLVENAEALDRFVREARGTSGLKHPGIVDVFDAGMTAEGRPYIVMELLEGESLEERLIRERRLSAFVVCALFAQVARALDAAHRAGIVHRDLSSPNVFLMPDESGAVPVAKILDFGVMKTIAPEPERRVRTGNGCVVGSPEYLSPEQASGADDLDYRTDLWSLGVLLYESLAGTPPFRGRNFNALLFAITSTPHVPLIDLVPDVDRELVEVVESCLVKDRECRLWSGAHVADRLERIAWRLDASGADQPCPRRRSTDRFVVPALLTSSGRVAKPERSALPERRVEAPIPALRQGAAAAHAAQPLRSSGVLAACSAVVGTALGLAVGVVIATSSEREPRVTSLVLHPASIAETEPARTPQPNAALVDSEPSQTAAANAPTVSIVQAKASSPVESAAPAQNSRSQKDEDLISAAARGLGLTNSASRSVRSAHSARPVRGTSSDVDDRSDALIANVSPPRRNPY